MKTVGLIEEIEIKGMNGKKKVMAKFDTGATRTSVDVELAAEVGLGPVIGTKTTVSSLGQEKRPMVKCTLDIMGGEYEADATLSDRGSGKHGKHPVLIGRDLIHENFKIDITKTHNSHKLEDVKNGD